MKRTIAATVIAGLAAMQIALAGTWETSAFRTANGQLVRIGMTKSEVRRDAGAPIKGKVAALADDQASSASSKKKRGEVWVYKGSDGYYALTFRGGRVARIDVTPFRGY